MTNQLWFAIFDFLGIAVFAASGTLLAHRKQLDGFGVLVLASLTAIGGGTIRDILLDVPVFWIQDNSVFYTIAAAAAITVIVLRIYGDLPKKVLLTADALGLAFFVIVGTQKALDVGVSYLIAVIMGTATGVAGGMLRDVLVQNTPMILKQELYATVCIMGSVSYIALQALGLEHLLAMAISMSIIFCLRMAAIYWHWGLPVFGDRDPYRLKKK
ncbi:MAG: trimeric intracellular cation channel family protein [Cellvibrionaceae bacterium]|nr:trimeric intracellular cation channel family protein [Cellvibrionaceae bacterium]